MKLARRWTGGGGRGERGEEMLKLRPDGPLNLYADSTFHFM